MTYRSKRRSRRRGTRPAVHQQEAIGNPGYIGNPGTSIETVFLGTVASLVPQTVRKPELCVMIAGRYEVRVSSGFRPETLARVVRTLEQLA